MKSSVSFFAVSLAVLTACGGREPEPDVFFLVCDTLRADHLGCYGYERDVSPAIDSLAQESTLFRRSITSAPATMPAMWNMMLSQYQSVVPSPPEDFTLAEYFKTRGYATGGFVAQRFLQAGMSNLDQGFDRYDDEQELDQYLCTKRRATSVTDSAIEWLDTVEDGRPVFAWLVYFDPHDPYVPPKPDRGVYNPADAPWTGDRRALGLMRDQGPEITPEHRQFLINAYDEEIRYMDRELGRFLDHLRASGRFDDAVVVFTSDHGEELGDNGGLWDHSQLLSEEEIRVPLLVKLPGVEGVATVDQPVQNIDVFPTLVDYLEPDSDLLGSGRLAGTSLLGLVRGEFEPDRLAFALWQGQIACYDPSYKYWVRIAGDRVSASAIDLRTGAPVPDPTTVRRLEKEADRFWRDGAFSGSYWNENVGRLKDLGYF